MFRQGQAVQMIRARLTPARWQHSLGVAETARELAVIHGMDADQAYMAGLLHDYARDLSASEILAIARLNHLITDQVEILVPDLLHGPVGACLLAREQGIDDDLILQAIRCHTLGAEHMSQLDKIIFLADMIEPSRKSYPALQALRRLSRGDLDQAVLLGLESTISYCLERRKLLHPLAVRARNALLIGRWPKPPVAAGDGQDPL